MHLLRVLLRARRELIVRASLDDEPTRVDDFLHGGSSRPVIYSAAFGGILPRPWGNLGTAARLSLRTRLAEARVAERAKRNGGSVRERRHRVSIILRGGE